MYLDSVARRLRVVEKDRSWCDRHDVGTLCCSRRDDAEERMEEGEENERSPRTD